MEGLELGCQDGLALSRGGIESLLLNVLEYSTALLYGKTADVLGGDIWRYLCSVECRTVQVRQFAGYPKIISIRLTSSVTLS